VAAASEFGLFGSRERSVVKRRHSSAIFGGAFALLAALLGSGCAGPPHGAMAATSVTPAAPGVAPGTALDSDVPASPPPMPKDKKGETCPEMDERVFICEDDPSCRGQKGGTPHERECWAVSHSISNLDSNVRRDIDDSCALRYWAADLDAYGGLTDRALANNIIQTSSVDAAARQFAAAQHSLGRAARAMAVVLEKQDGAAYPAVWRDLKTQLRTCEAATLAYVAACADTE